MKTIAEQILDGLSRFYAAFQTRRVLKTMEEVNANTDAQNIPSALLLGELNNKLNSLILGQTKIKYGAVSLQCSSGDYAQTTINVDEYRSYQIMVSQSTSHNGVTVCSAGNIIYAFRNSSAVMNIGINYIVIGTLK